MISSYGLHLAKIANTFNCLPTELSYRETEEYLYHLTQRNPSPSMTYFKMAVYGLRFVYRMEGLTHRYVELPKIRHIKKLPVVLSKAEMKRLIDVTTNRKHRVLLYLLYGCGLRCREIRDLMLSDIDYDRQTIHIRQGKGSKDRYVPLSQILTDELELYIKSVRPKKWLFNAKKVNPTKDFDRYSK